jgi:hypothetical protein
MYLKIKQQKEQNMMHYYAESNFLKLKWEKEQNMMH